MDYNNDKAVFLANVYTVIVILVTAVAVCLFGYVMYLLIRYLKQNLKK